MEPHTPRVDFAGLALIEPDVRYHPSWLAAAEEFAQEGDYQHGSGLIPDSMPDEEVKGEVWRQRQMTDPQRFAAYAADMRARRHRAVTEPLGLVPDSKLWIVSGDTFLGSLSLRHELNAWLLAEGGHIGYSVRPTARQQGVATRTLLLALDHARALGIPRALLTCDDDNAASAGTIERCGGVLEDIRAGKRRYWIDVPAS